MKLTTPDDSGACSYGPALASILEKYGLKESWELRSELTALVYEAHHNGITHCQKCLTR